MGEGSTKGSSFVPVDIPYDPEDPESSEFARQAAEIEANSLILSDPDLAREFPISDIRKQVVRDMVTVDEDSANFDFDAKSFGAAYRRFAVTYIPNKSPFSVRADCDFNDAESVKIAKAETIMKADLRFKADAEFLAAYPDPEVRQGAVKTLLDMNGASEIKFNYESRQFHAAYYSYQTSMKQANARINPSANDSDALSSAEIDDGDRLAISFEGQRAQLLEQVRQTRDELEGQGIDGSPYMPVVAGMGLGLGAALASFQMSTRGDIPRKQRLMLTSKFYQDSYLEDETWKALLKDKQARACLPDSVFPQNVLHGQRLPQANDVMAKPVVKAVYFTLGLIALDQIYSLIWQMDLGDFLETESGSPADESGLDDNLTGGEADFSGLGSAKLGDRDQNARTEDVAESRVMTTTQTVALSIIVDRLEMTRRVVDALSNGKTAEASEAYKVYADNVKVKCASVPMDDTEFYDPTLKDLIDALSKMHPGRLLADRNQGLLMIAVAGLSFYAGNKLSSESNTDMVNSRYEGRGGIKAYYDKVDELDSKVKQRKVDFLEGYQECKDHPEVVEAQAKRAIEAAAKVAKEAAEKAKPANPAPVAVPGALPAPTAFSATLPGGMAIPEISIPYEFSPAEFFSRGGGWQLSPAYSVARGGTYFGAGEPPPMEVKVYNMARTMETAAKEMGAPKGSGGTKAPSQGFGARMGQAAKGVALYTGGYVLINGAMLYFRTPQELQDYVNGVYGAAGIAAMVKNPAFAAYIPSGMLGAEIANDLTYDAIESTNLNDGVKAFAHGTAQVVGGGGAVVGTLYAASRLGMSTPVTALVSGLCLGIYQSYKRHQSLEKARSEFFTMAADYEQQNPEAPKFRDLFASLEVELPQILNSNFDAGDRDRLREIMQSPYYADVMTGMGWYFHERYFKAFMNEVLPGVEEFSIGGSPDSPGGGNYQDIRKSFGGELYLLSLEMRCYPAKDVIQTFSKNLKVPMTEAGYEAMHAAVHDPKNAEVLKEYGPVLVEKLIDLWLGNVGYATGIYSTATWFASSSEQWAKRKEVGAAYGAKVAQLKSWILNPSAMHAEDEQFARMKQASDASRVAALEKNLDEKVAAKEITRAKADQIERDAVMSGTHLPQTFKVRTAAEIEAGQKHYSWMVSQYVDGMTGAFEENFWSSHSTEGMVSDLSNYIRLIKPDGDVAKGDITPGVFVTMLWRWLDDVQQHLHSREAAGWGQAAVWGGHMDAEEIRAANDELQLLRAKLAEYEKSGDANLLGDSVSYISDSKNTIFGVMGKIDRMVGEHASW